MELPSREDYPDYYEIIKEPIAIDVIQGRIDSDHYKGSHKDFVADLDLMFKNAKTYNEQGSQVYDDATYLQKLVASTIKQLFPKGKPPRVQMIDPARAEKRGRKGERPPSTYFFFSPFLFYFKKTYKKKFFFFSFTW